ncbi:putative transposase [Sinorhizobium alkalisoli]|nr:putative transposase [Sinorhizobium alkalisoli]
MEEVRCSLADRGLFFGFGTIQRFFKRHNMTRKKVRMPRSKTDLTS